MEYLFALLLFLSPVALIVSLIRPGIFRRLFRRNLSRTQLSTLFLGATALFFVLTGLTAGESSEKKVVDVLGESAGDTQVTTDTTVAKETNLPESSVEALNVVTDTPSPVLATLPAPNTDSVKGN